MFKVRERSGLLSCVLHLTPTLKTTDCNAYHSSNNKNESQICWRKNWTANHSKAKLPLSHSLTNRKPWWRFRKRGDALLTKVVIRKWCWESYKNKEPARERCSEAKPRSPFKSTKGLFSTVQLSCGKDSSHVWQQENSKDVNVPKTLCKSPRVLSPRLINCD